MDTVLGPVLDYLPHYARLWLSHGPGCGSTNAAAMGAENGRGAAGAALAKVASALSANLQTSREMYTATDDEQTDALSKAMQF
jgi:hypothetical protein